MSCFIIIGPLNSFIATNSRIASIKLFFMNYNFSSIPETAPVDIDPNVNRTSDAAYVIPVQPIPVQPIPVQPIHPAPDPSVQALPVKAKPIVVSQFVNQTNCKPF